MYKLMSDDFSGVVIPTAPRTVSGHIGLVDWNKKSSHTPPSYLPLTIQEIRIRATKITRVFMFHGVMDSICYLLSR